MSHPRWKAPVCSENPISKTSSSAAPVVGAVVPLFGMSPGRSTAVHVAAGRDSSNEPNRGGRQEGV